MLEKEIEQYLCKKVKNELHGRAFKFVSPGFNGVPDRIVLVPMGRIYFVELKAPGKTPRKLQIKRMSQLRKLGFLVYVADDTGMIGGILDEIQTP